MGHVLKKLRVNKISILTEASPATGIPLVILKSSEDTKELIKEVEEFWDREFDFDDFGKADRKELIAALKEANKYREDLPLDLKSAWDKIIGWAVKGYGDYGKYPTKKSEDVQKPDNSWASFAPPIPQYLIKKSEEEEVLEEGFDPDDEYLSPLIKRIKKLEEGSEQIRDDWPSLDKIFPGKAVVVKKVKVETEPKNKLRPQSQQIRESDIEIKVEKEEEDLWPTMITPMDLGVVPKG